MAEEEKSRQEKVKEITEQLHEGIKQLFQSDKYKDYLRTMSKFTNYSFNNTVLIAIQRPEAQAVAGYRAWQTKFDRHVKKGSKAIAIIEPTIWKKQKQEIIVDDKGNPMRDEDGNIIKQKSEERLTGFKVGHVFAYEDTEGKELPSIVNLLNKDVEGYDGLMDVIKTISPVPIYFETIGSAANGYFNLETRDIHVESSLPELQKVKTTIHEMAHSLLHDKISGEDPDANNYEREVCAESVAFTVCSYLGLDTSDYSFGYVGGWSSGKELKELQEKMEIIRKTANTIIDKIETEVLTRNEKATQAEILQAATLQPAQIGNTAITMEMPMPAVRPQTHRHRR